MFVHSPVFRLVLLLLVLFAFLAALRHIVHSVCNELLFVLCHSFQRSRSTFLEVPTGLFEDAPLVLEPIEGMMFLAFFHLCIIENFKDYYSDQHYH